MLNFSLAIFAEKEGDSEEEEEKKNKEDEARRNDG